MAKIECPLLVLFSLFYLLTKHCVKLLVANKFPKLTQDSSTNLRLYGIWCLCGRRSQKQRINHRTCYLEDLELLVPGCQRDGI